MTVTGGVGPTGGAGLDETAFRTYLKAAPRRPHGTLGDSRSDATVRAYMECVRKGENWCRARGLSLAEVVPETLQAWLEELPGPRRQQAGIAVRHYWRMVGRETSKPRRPQVPKTPGPPRLPRTGAVERDRQLAGFRGHLVELGYGDRAAGDCVQRVWKVQTWCRSEDLDVATLDREDLLRFVASRRNGSLGAAARRSLRLYWRYIEREDAPLEAIGARISSAGRAVPTEANPGPDGSLRRRPGPGVFWTLTPNGEPVNAAGLLFARGLSYKTVRLYAGYWRRVARWCRDNGSTIEHCTELDLLGFMATFPRTHSARTQLRYSMVALWKVTGRRDHPEPETILIPKGRRRKSRALTEPQARILEQAARERGDRHGLAVLFGLYAGLRVYEIAKVRWDDLEDGWLEVVGKGDNHDRIPVHPVLAFALDRTPRDGSPWVFPGMAGVRAYVAPATIWAWVRDLSEELGLGLVKTHQLRHTAITTVNDATGNLRSAQAFARHSDPEMTAGYSNPRKLRLTRETLVTMLAE